MRLTVEKRTFRFAFKVNTSRGSYTERTSWFIRATDDSRPGITGIGECAPLPGLSPEAGPDYESRLKAFCREAETASGTGPVLESMRDCPSMLFGLETALRHLETGSPKLYDTPFTRGLEPIAINGLVWMNPLEVMLAEMERKVEAGFRCIKLKIGSLRFDDELEMLRRLRARFTPRQLEIRLDANGAFKPEEALDRLYQLAQYGVHSIEQPIRAGQWGYMSELCRESPLPIALDEELISATTPDMKDYMLRLIRPQYIVVKPSLHGGLSGAGEWVATARSLGIGSWLTSALETNVGLNAIACLASYLYPDPARRLRQGLGTGRIFTDNTPSTLSLDGEELRYL